MSRSCNMRLFFGVGTAHNGNASLDDGMVYGLTRAD